jgi:hypothetical protein
MAVTINVQMTIQKNGLAVKKNLQKKTSQVRGHTEVSVGIATGGHGRLAAVGESPGE